MTIILIVAAIILLIACGFFAYEFGVEVIKWGVKGTNPFEGIAAVLVLVSGFIVSLHTLLA